MIINTDNNGVFDEDVIEQIGTALDEAQGYVFGGDGRRAFVVIEVTKE